MIGTQDCRPRLAADFCVPAAPAPSIQNSLAVKAAEQKTGLCLKRGAVFSVVGHVKTGPLMAKTFQMFVADKSWNTIDDFPRAALSLMFAALRRHLPVATKSLALDLEALR